MNWQPVALSLWSPRLSWGFRRKKRGSAAIEWLAAAPIVMLLGLGVLQWGLVFFGRSSLEYALTQAAREGAQGNAIVANIESGLARGLIPYWGLATPGQPLDLALPGALIQLNAEKATGALVWRQIAPTNESFTDWAVPARDAMGEEIVSVVEIPNDALQYRQQTVGASSGQTLKDANILKLEMRYGIALNVPLIAPIAVRIMEQINGCPAASLGGIVLGSIRLPAASAAEKASGTHWACAFYRAKDGNGADQLRWPVQTIAMVRMQTPARKTGVTASRAENPLALGVVPADTGVPPPGSTNPSSNGEAGASYGGGSQGTGANAGTGTERGIVGVVTVGEVSTGAQTSGTSGGGSQNASTGGVTTGSPNQNGGQNSGGQNSGGTTAGQAGGQSSSPTSFSQEVLSRIEQEGQAKAIGSCPQPGIAATSKPG
jgi:TadE-like protein